jgi:hypothetical protein
VDTNAATALTLSASGRLRRVDDSHVLCTSTLGVLHNAASRAARMGLLACRSARHAVVELKITVKLNTDLKFIDRERGNIGRGTATKAGAARDIRMGFAGDACVLGYVSKGDHKLSWLNVPGMFVYSSYHAWSRRRKRWHRRNHRN